MLRDLIYSLLIRIDFVLLLAGGVLLATGLNLFGWVLLIIGALCLIIRAAKNGMFGSGGGSGGGCSGCGGCAGCGGCGGN